MFRIFLGALLTFLIALCPGLLSAADLLVTEFLANRTVQVTDNFGDPADFIEVYNAGPSDVDLGGYFLSDGCTERFKWTFPAGVILGPDEFVVVWATEKDVRESDEPLHASFRLDGAGGECVTLSDPFGDPIQVDDFYPKQYIGYSYGVPMDAQPSSLSLVQPGSACTVTVPSASNPVPGTDWTGSDPNYDDSGWVAGQLGVGYDTNPDYHSSISLDLAVSEPMRDVNPTCYIRIPFQVVDPAAITSLDFAMRYDDGYVAYINGTRVTSRNAPAVLNSGSFSEGFQVDANALNFEPAAFDEGTPTLVAGENILAIHGLNETEGSSDFLVLPRLIASVDPAGGGMLQRNDRHYFTPSPGAPNVTGAADVSPEPLFSEPAGAYPAGLEIVLSMESPVAGTVIRYTLDESIPTEFSTLYTAPIPVDDEVVITAKAFVPGMLPSEPTSRYFVILGDDLVNFSSTVPIVICSMLGDRLPTASPSTCGHGPYLDGRFLIWTPDEITGRARFSDMRHYQHRAGFRKRGNPDFSCGRQKFFFNVETRDWEGKDDDEQFLDFASHSDYAMWGPHEFDRAMMRNPIAFWMSREVGHWSPRTQHVECFMRNPGNPSEMDMGDYWGVYVLMERVERGAGRVDVRRLSETYNSEPLITGGYILKRDRIESGDTSLTVGLHHNVVFTYPRAPTAAQRSWASNFFNSAVFSLNPNIGSQADSTFIDVESFLDHHILSWFPKSVDAFRLSGFFFKTRGGLMEMGPLWDYDRTMGCCNSNVDPRPTNPSGWGNDGWDGGTRYFENPGPSGDGGLLGSWYGRLFDNRTPTGFNPWEVAYRNRWRELRQGPLATANIMDRLDTWAAALVEPAERNTARWPNVAPRFGGFLGEVDHLKNWLTTRADWIDGQFEDIDGSFIPVPTFSHPGGMVAEGFQVEIMADFGVIFYTLNGPDPRAPGGAVDPAAVFYNSPITINVNTRIRARVRDGSNWSDLVEGTFATTLVSLVVTEVMYNPRALGGDSFGKSLYEYLEFYNPGNEEVDLQNVVLDDPFFDFGLGSVTSLGAGEYLVVARDEDAFAERYSTEDIQFAGEFSGGLSNTSEQILVNGPAGEILMDFNYQSSWEPTTNGQGHTLVIVDPTADPSTWNSGSSWRASFELEGSPGIEDSLPPLPQRRHQGDLNGTGTLDISDVTSFLFNLFGQLTLAPCATDQANITLQDVDGDGVLTVNDAIRLMRYLFLAGTVPDMGVGCETIEGCPDACAP